MRKNKMKLFQTWKSVMFDPVNFYRKLSDKERYVEATKYFLKVQAIITAITLVLVGLIIAGLSRGVGNLKPIVFGLIIIYPILLLFSWGMLYASTGIIHLFVLLFGGKKGYAETFKVLAYSISPTIFAMIPFIVYAAVLYSLILQIIGIRERQKMSLAKSIAIVLIPTVIIITLITILYVLIAPYIARPGLMG